MPGTTISRGNILVSQLMSTTLTPTAVLTVAVTEQAFSVPGLQVGDQVSVTANFAWTGLTTLVSSRVSAANTLAISFANTTAGTLTPPSGAYLIEVNRPESLPLPANAA